MRLYRSREGDMPDVIARDELGAEAQVLALLEANPGLAAEPLPLPAGVVIRVPDAAPATPAAPLRLWGRG